MLHTELCLEALSVLSGCIVEQNTEAPKLSLQEFSNIVALKEFYKQEGLNELEYPDIGIISLQDRAGPEERPTVTIDPQDFFHPEYDCDFTNAWDGNIRFMRGNEQYTRPCGWVRAALRVMQKYDGGDRWLGTGKDAWPVSYNGHNTDGFLSINLKHDKSFSKEPNFLDVPEESLFTGEIRGRGVNSTPDIYIAEEYCKKFKSSVDGKTYKVVLQNRINPENLMKCQRKDIWLVYIPEGCNFVQTRAIVQESIRPYGLLLKQA